MTLLTVEEFRTFVDTDLEDSPLQVLLDAAEATIIAFLGEADYLGQRVEIRDGGSRVIFLTRRAVSIDTITETIGNTETTLDADDWLLRSDGLSLERLSNGTNSPSWLYGVPGSWGGRVTVTYTALEDLDNQKRVQVGLMRLSLDQSSPATSFRIGEYSESGGSSTGTSEETRQALLNSLLPAVWTFA